jgi:MFS family permease
MAALAGTLGRFASGALLDRGRPCGLPVLLAAACGIGGDALLLGAQQMGGYGLGQVLIGLAGGFYWPAVELAVPLCAAPEPSARGFALVRSADAAGVAAGTLTGALLAQAGLLRGIYLVDMAAVLLLAGLIWLRPLPRAPRAVLRPPGQAVQPVWGWLRPLLPLLLLSVVATAIPVLMQVALPLDLVRGGLERDAQPEAISALLIGLQLGLLVLLQWPVGQALARRPVAQGLGIGLVCFSLGTGLLALSALSEAGLGVVLLALFPLALGEAAFLPIATEAVVELTPAGHGGLAMALFSQCFALSALVAPVVTGMLLDSQRHGVVLWLLTSLCCAACLLLLPAISRRAHRA